jgi:hypothetical protein
VRASAGAAKGRTTIRERRDSVSTVRCGRSVTPAPAATVWAKVDRLVARKPSSCASAAALLRDF